MLSLGVAWYWLRRNGRRITYPTAQSLTQFPRTYATATRHNEDELHIQWQWQADAVYLYTGHDPLGTTEGRPAVTVRGNVNSVTLGGHPVSQVTYFTLRFEGGPHDSKRLVVAERELALEGAVNFRDVGGYHTADGRAVRWGRVYRAGQLHNLTDSDLAKLTQMGLKRACDLRLPEETAEAPDRLPETTHYEAIPVQSSETRAEQIRRLMSARGRMDDFMVSAYTDVIIDNNPDVYARVFERIADRANLPLVVHCTAGKDRTGVATALLLALLGVPDETIEADYALSNLHYNTFEALGEDAIRSFGRIGLDTQTLLPLFTANPKTIRAALAHVRGRYGSVERYLIDAGGLSAETLDRVRDHLLM